MPLTREFTLRALEREKDGDGDLLVEMAFASDKPYKRWWGIEVLVVSDEAVRLERLNDGGALLYNHDWDDQRGTHVPGSVRAHDDGVLRGEVRIESVTQKGRDTIGLVERGFLTKASVGYQIHKVIEQSTIKGGKKIERELDGSLFERVLERSAAGARGDRRAFQRALDAAAGRIDRADDDEPVYRVVDWEPLENSLVTVPADNSVGVGRSATKTVSPPAAPAASHGGHHMADSTNAAAGAQAETRQAPAVPVSENGTPEQRLDPVAREKSRQDAIRKLAEAMDIRDESTVRHWILSGKEFDAIGEEALQIKIQRGKVTDSRAYLGLTPAETRRFSIVRAVRAIVDNNWNEAGFEAECSRAIAQRLGRVMNGNSIMVPVDVQARTLIVGTAAQGGYAVGTNLQPENFVELLRNRSVAIRLGARTMSGLVGSVAIPKQATGGAVAWIGETGTATASELTLGQITMSPKHVAGFQQISRQLLLQSTPDAEDLVMRDLAGAIALGVDTAVLAGTSTDSSQPLGIRYTSGLGTANPTSGTAVTYADMIKFQSTVAAANALFDGFAYVTHPAVAAVVMAKPRFTNSDTPIWEGALLDGQMVGRRAMSSVQITSGTMLGGDFSQVIIGEWGALELAVNPYQVFQSGIIGVRGIYSCDVAVRYGAAFAIGTGISG